MFGNQVEINGFAALADKMEIPNQDGISQNSELKTLTELSITEIRTASTPVAPMSDVIVSNKTLFTCKTFTTLKALHVKIQRNTNEANGTQNRVAYARKTKQFKEISNGY